MKITIKNLFITAVINNKGAELISLKDKNNREYIWQGNPEFWGKHSPVLFPIVGTLKNNSFSYNAKKYNLLETYGSDFHNPETDYIGIEINQDNCEKIRESMVLRRKI